MMSDTCGILAAGQQPRDLVRSRGHERWWSGRACYAIAVSAMRRPDSRLHGSRVISCARKRSSIDGRRAPISFAPRRENEILLVLRQVLVARLSPSLTSRLWPQDVHSQNGHVRSASSKQPCRVGGGQVVRRCWRAPPTPLDVLAVHPRQQRARRRLLWRR